MLAHFQSLQIQIFLQLAYNKHIINIRYKKMSLQHFLDTLFDTKQYSLKLSLQRLRKFGGISCLLNRLSISNRQPILSSQPNISSQPSIQLHTLHSIDQSKKQDHHIKARKGYKKNVLLQNILLYFITLSFFIKLLLYKNSLRNLNDIYTEIIGFLFLMFRIYEAKIQSENQRISSAKQETSDKNNNKQYRIRRKGDEARVHREDIQKGDIIFYEKGDVIQFNCILMQIINPNQNNQNNDSKQQNFVIVNEDETDTGRNKCRKHTIWKAEEHNLLDPFIFRNTKLNTGGIWVLICQSTLQSSHHDDHQIEIEMNGLLQLSKTDKKIDSAIQVILIVVVIWLCVNWNLQKQKDNYNILLKFIYLISCLTLYLSYINYNEVFGLIQKYLKDSITAKGYGYKIMNSRIIYQLERVDLILIEQDCLDRIDFKMLTLINEHIDLKLITTDSQSRIYGKFGSDLNDQLIFNKEKLSGDESYSKMLEQLSKSKILKLSSQNYEKELRYIMQIYKEMNFQMIFVGKNRVLMKENPEVVSILTMKDNIVQNHLNGQWVRIISQQTIQGVLIQLLQKTKTYKTLKQLYYTIMFNSCLEILILVIWALNGCLISLNLNLLIMYFDNKQIYKFYKNVISKKYITKRQGKFSPISMKSEFNITIFLHYCFMMFQIYKSPDRNFQLFLWLMVNRLFRLEGLGRDVDGEVWRKRFGRKMVGMVLLVIVEIGVNYYSDTSFNLVNELLDVLLLPIIMIVYFNLI